MAITGRKSIFSVEPIQWAVDYLQSLLDILEEKKIGSNYGSALLALEREELHQVWRRLLGSYDKDCNPVFYAGNKEGARLFVVRQLLAALPPLKPCVLHGSATVFEAAAKRLAEEHDFLGSFSLPLDEKAPGAEIVTRAVDIIAARGMCDRLVLSGRRLHVYCLEYKLPHPAYYLYPSHTIICGATNFNEEEQLHCLLHEFGHILYASSTRRLPADATLRKKMAERFAHKFASSLLPRV